MLGKLKDRVGTLHVTKFLRMGKNAVIKIMNSDSSVSTIDLAELAAIDSIGAADLAKIDGITNGVGAAGKALVPDANGNVVMPDDGMFGFSRAAVAAAGSTSADAAVLADQVNAVTASDGAKGVALPAAATTEGPILVINTVATANLLVYPVDGGNDQINGLAEDAAITMGPGESMWFIPTSATQWYTTNVSKGTGYASGYVTLDSNGDFDMPDGGQFNKSADTLAAAGSTSADAAALVDQITVVTGADGAKGVVLPAAADLEEYTVVNDSNTYAVKVYPVDSGDDVINDLASDEPFIVGPGREVTFKATSATQWYAPRSQAGITRATHFNIFDDFTYATFDETDNWISFEGAGATAAAVVTAPEGKLNMVCGANGDATDGTSLSLILVAKGSLVSLGTTVFEARVAADVISGCNICIGLSDTLAEANEHGLYRVSGTTVSDGGLTLTNAACFVFDKDATADTVWHYVSENAGTISNSGTVQDASVGPTADTYQVLRIEVDASGDTRFYIDGVLEATTATAVATTSLLIPFISVDEAGTPAACTLSVDYIDFAGARPSSNA